MLKIFNNSALMLKPLITLMGSSVQEELPDVKKKYKSIPRNEAMIKIITNILKNF